MPIIKFSHQYTKLQNIGLHGEICYPLEMQLLEVFEVQLEELSKEFLTYDTDNGKYVLPKKGLYLMLVFRKSTENIVTTLRRHTREKAIYYKKQIGKIFNVEYNIATANVINGIIRHIASESNLD